MNVTPGQEFETISPEFAGELDGIAGVRIRTSDGDDFLARTTLGIAADVTVGSTALYRVTLTAPTTAGRYWIVWDDGTAVADPVELVVTYTAAIVTPPSGRDLCTTADVLRYIPGYAPNEETDAVLAALVTAESDGIHHETGREIVATGEQPQARIFRFDDWACRRRRVEVGDLSTVDALVVETLSADEQEATTVTLYRGLYENQRRFRRQPWEPLVELEFPTGDGQARLVAGRSVRVTGVWGFPEIPSFIREAAAKRVILRYASDVASAGTQLAAAIAEVNLAGLFASSRDDIDRLKRLAVMVA